MTTLMAFSQLNGVAMQISKNSQDLNGAEWIFIDAANPDASILMQISKVVKQESIITMHTSKKEAAAEHKVSNTFLNYQLRLDAFAPSSTLTFTALDSAQGWGLSVDEIKSVHFLLKNNNDMLSACPDVILVTDVSGDVYVARKCNFTLKDKEDTFSLDVECACHECAK